MSPPIWVPPEAEEVVMETTSVTPSIGRCYINITTINCEQIVECYIFAYFWDYDLF